MPSLDRRQIISMSGLFAASFSGTFGSALALSQEAPSKKPVVLNKDLTDYVADEGIRIFSKKLQSPISGQDYQHFATQIRLLGRHMSGLDGLDTQFRLLASNTVTKRGTPDLDMNTMQAIMGSNLSRFQQVDPTITLYHLTSSVGRVLTPGELTQGCSLIADNGLSGLLYLCADVCHAQGNYSGSVIAVNYHTTNSSIAHFQLASTCAQRGAYYSCVGSVYAGVAILIGLLAVVGVTVASACAANPACDAWAAGLAAAQGITVTQVIAIIAAAITAVGVIATVIHNLIADLCAPLLNAETLMPPIGTQQPLQLTPQTS